MALIFFGLTRQPPSSSGTTSKGEEGVLRENYASVGRFLFGGVRGQEIGIPQPPPKQPSASSSTKAAAAVDEQPTDKLT
jgi:hypothetical protein